LAQIDLSFSERRRDEQNDGRYEWMLDGHLGSPKRGLTGLCRMYAADSK
jgi:hypothetical protein